MIEARNWESFIEHDEVNLERAYEKAILQICSEQAISEDLVPEIEDAEVTFKEAAAGRRPHWWPSKIHRILIVVKATPVGATVESLGPSPIDPNGRDLGKKVFVNTLGHMLETMGASFEGALQIRLLRATDKQQVGGWRGEAFIGERRGKKKRGQDDGASSSAEEIEYLNEQISKRDAALLAAMNANTSGMHAASAVINATRGVNAAPPWMQGEGDSTPMWAAMMQGIMGLVPGLMAGQPPSRAIRELMQQQVPSHPMLEARQENVQSPQGRGQITEDLGSDQFLSEGDYDGYEVYDEDLVDDELGGNETEEEEEGEGGVEDEEDDPLAGKSPEEIIQILSAHIDKHPEQKAALKSKGMALATKLLGG